MEGSRLSVRTPAGDLELKLPLPGPLQRLQRAGGDRRRAGSWGSKLESVRSGLESMRALFGRVETIEVDGKPVSILLIKNPAGANEVLRTLRLESDGEDLDLWLALNDRIADGRDVSWIWDADFELLAGAARRVTCSGTRAPEMALRLKYAGWPPESIAVETGDRGFAASARWPRPTDACSRCPPTPPCWSCGTCWPTGVWRRSTGSERCEALQDAVDLARRRVRRLRGRPAALGASLPSGGGPVLELGCGTGRVALHLARRGHRVTGIDSDAALVGELRQRASAEALPVRAEQADAATFSLA